MSAEEGARPPAKAKPPAVAAEAVAEPARPRRALPPSPHGFDGSANAPLSAAAVTATLVEGEDRRDALTLVTATLVRLTAVAWLAATVVLWMRLVGWGHSDIVPALHDPEGPWLTTMTAAVVAPVVAVGLWLRGRWGLVVWAAAIVGGGVLFALRPDLVPFGRAALGGNVAMAVLVAAVSTVAAVRRHRAGDA